MNNRDAYVNELSLMGQYDDIEEFLSLNKDFVYVLSSLKNKGYNLLKKYNLYEYRITCTDPFSALLRYRSNKGNGNNDLLRKLKINLLDMCNHEPFWTISDNEKECCLNDENVTGSSVARATINNGILLSFSKSGQYDNKMLEICLDNGTIQNLYSINSPRMLAEELFNRGEIDGDEYLRLRYRNTRLDFSKMHQEYGTGRLEKKEIADFINSFDKFISFLSWNEILEDDSLHYKKYSPSSDRHDCFFNTVFKDKTICKFRCINPKRCFGYREGDVFYVLRLERTHEISDFG
ncbi:hypothetical protein SAMN02910275_02445 [Butyrivibrio sp. INlla18]|uniref:hypothetical protein n=1 Tax=Butyrivibrio sp. INlla18 TaxID=1520806 RepID=UPI00088432E4|nr:hypothetical protein [Butyrivibrio sp. INlla18]SDA73106.1 hypothetical protein SAMN02910275_02445 [Butyrivibrio sp. INlla18]